MNLFRHQSKGVQVTFLVILILLVAVCGVHVVGSHHDGEPAGQGMADSSNLAVFLIGIVLTIFVAAGTRPLPSAGVPRPPDLAYRRRRSLAVGQTSPLLEAPLRC